MRPLPNWSGFTPVYYTQIPDEFFDIWLPHLLGAECKVLCYLMRHTFGWKKIEDRISFSQITDGIVRQDGTRLDGGAGVSRSTAQTAVDGLIAKGLIAVEPTERPDGGNGPNCYYVRMAESVTPPYTENRHRGSAENRHRVKQAPMSEISIALDRKSVTQETTIQETVKQETDDSNPAPPKKIETTRTTGKHRGLNDHPPLSPYVAAVIGDFSRELGDMEHSAANITQALRLRAASGLDDEAFVQQCYTAKRLLRQAQAHGVDNKMAYFFTILRRALEPPDAPAA